MLLNDKAGFNQKTITASVNIVSAYDTHVAAPHRHLQKSFYPTYHCLLYTLSGSGMVVLTDGSIVHLQEKEIFLSKFSNIRMLECREGDWHYHIVWFQPSGVNFPLNTTIQAPERDEQEEFMEELLRLLNTGSVFDLFHANCKLLNRIADLLSLYNQQHETYAFTSRADEIIKYIDEHIHENLRLKEVATKFNYCEKQLRTIVLKKVGMLPKRYVITSKLKKACELLDSTTYTVEYIAYSLGFSSASHFMNLFKKTYKITPIEYRQHSKKI